MYGDEQDVRDVLAENPSLIEEGLELVEKERRVSTGFIDLLCRDKDGRLVVVEVKRGKAGAEAVIQLKRYVDALKNELNLKVRGILVAEALSRGVKPLLEREGLEFKRLDLKKIDGEGDFPCPKCGATISPDDVSEETYRILELSLIHI